MVKGQETRSFSYKSILNIFLGLEVIEMRWIGPKQEPARIELAEIHPFIQARKSERVYCQHRDYDPAESQPCQKKRLALTHSPNPRALIPQFEHGKAALSLRYR